MSGTQVKASPTKSSRSGNERALLRRYILKRMGVSVLLVGGVGTLLFVLMQLVPGDPVLVLIGEDAANDPAARQAVIDRYGLDQPLYVQFTEYWAALFRGDLGESMRTRRPVADEIMRSFPATMELGAIGGAMALVLGVFLGILSALKRNKLIDQVIRVASLGGISMPVFWTALVSLYVFHFQLGIFPTVGRLAAGADPPPHLTGAYTIDALVAGQFATFWDAVSHLMLPALVLAAYMTTVLARFTRSAVLEILSEDYIRTAHAKGLRFRTVVSRHVLRAASVPILTMVGVIFTSVLTGTVLIETIFGFPGMGNLMYLSAIFLDVPTITGVGLVVAVIYIGINFVVDLLYGVVDPRIRME